MEPAPRAKPIISEWKERPVRNGLQIFRDFWGPRYLAWAGIYGLFLICLFLFPDRWAKASFLIPINLIPLSSLFFGTRFWAPIVRKDLLIDDPNGRHSCVHVLYREKRNGFLTGIDEGVVLVEDGWLIFEGLRTRFAVRRTDGAKPRQVRSEEPALELDTSYGYLYVTFRNTLRPKDLPPGSQGIRPIRKLLTSWAAKKDFPEGIPCLPPMVPDPAVLAEDLAVVRVRHVAIFALAMIAIAFCPWLGVSNAREELVVLGICLPAGALAFVIAVWTGVVTDQARRMRRRNEELRERQRLNAGRERNPVTHWAPIERQTEVRQ
ncbi:MAG TPA: hypothetical protein VG944_16300 [Fimbriimonas sp.]|nr:hypothetical protein [Fimbriimonas sp.]